MKFILTAIGIMIALSFQQPQQEPKRYSVQLTIPEWDARIGQLEAIKNQIKQSDISYKNASYMIDSILSPFQQLIYYQINMQIRAETGSKGIKPDSTGKQKKN